MWLKQSSVSQRHSYRHTIKHLTITKCVILLTLHRQQTHNSLRPTVLYHNIISSWLEDMTKNSTPPNPQPFISDGLTNQYNAISEHRARTLCKSRATEWNCQKFQRSFISFTEIVTSTVEGKIRLHVKRTTRGKGGTG